MSKMYKCRVCKSEYTKRSSFQKACSVPCARIYVADQKKKEQRKKDKEWKEENKSRSELTKEAQREFNKYIRIRDHYRPCISCGVDYGDKYLVNRGSRWDAGHYRSTGSAAHMRFNTYNVHKQCVYCNRDMSGNIVEYRLSLIKRIGEDKVIRLETDNSIVKLDKDYLRRVRDIFRKRARLMKKRYGL